MTFFRFITKNYKGQESPEGDLAADILADKKGQIYFKNDGFGKYLGHYDSMMRYLRKSGACVECREAFRNVFYEYVLSELMRRKRTGDISNSTILKRLTQKMSRNGRKNGDTKTTMRTRSKRISAGAAIPVPCSLFHVPCSLEPKIYMTKGDL